MVDYTMLASNPSININAIGNALAMRQHLQDQPMRQMQSAAELERAKLQNRILFMQEAQAAAAEEARRANVEEMLNLGANGPQAAAGASNIPPPQNALAGMTGAPTVAPTPPTGWNPPMALPPEGGNALAAPPPTDVRAGIGPGVQDLVDRPRIPYSPQAEGQLAARMAMQKQIQDQLTAKVDLAKKIGEAIGPSFAEQFWNQDPMLRRLGPASITGDVQTKEVKVNGKPIGTMVKAPDGKWSFHEPKKVDNKIAGLDPADKKPVKQDAEGNLTKDGVPYTGGQLLPLTETRDQKSFDEQSAFKPIFENKMADFVKNNGRQPSDFEKNKLTIDTWREVVKEKAQFTAPTIFAGTIPGQPGTGITFTGRGGEGKAGTVSLPGGGMTGKEQKPLSEKAQEDLTASFQGLDILQTLKNTVGESGRVKGLFSKAGAWLGTNEDAIKFNTSRQQMWLMAQSAVKGIPSDKDMSMVMNSVPELWEPENVNNERIKVFERIFKNAIAAKISMYKGSNTIIPPEIIALAKSKGIAIDSVKPWDEVTPFNLTKGIDIRNAGKGKATGNDNVVHRKPGESVADYLRRNAK